MMAKTSNKNNVVAKEIQIVYVPIDDIRPNDYNPNKETPAQFEILKRSILDDGFTDPILLTKDKIIIHGEYRWRAAKEIGMSYVPCIIADMTNEQMRISTLRRGRTHGAHDLQQEAAVIRELERLGAIEWAKESLLLSEDEASVLLGTVDGNSLLNGSQSSDGLQNAIDVSDAMALMSNDRRLLQDSEDTGADAGLLRKIASGNKGSKTMTVNDEAEIVQDSFLQDDKEINKNYKVHVTFTGAQADIVSRVLSDKPKENLFALCKQVIERTSKK